MITKQSENHTITIQDFSELGLNSTPWKRKPQKIEIPKSEESIHTLMFHHNMTRLEAEKQHKENIESIKLLEIM